MSEDKSDLEKAKDQIAYVGKLPTSDGLRKWLMRELQHVTGPTLSPGALSYCEGRRSFALELLNLLEAELPESDRSSASTRPLVKRGTTRAGASSLARRVPVDPES